MGADLFYPSENDDRNKRNHARIIYAEARVVCMACPVRAACLEQALADGETSYGMYGGMSPNERRAHLRQRGARCGTVGGFSAGCSCDQCTEAWRARRRTLVSRWERNA
jgi:hypothetical protein